MAVASSKQTLARRDKLCEIAGEPEPFTGLRILHRHHLGWPSQHHWQIVRCTDGQVRSSTLLPSRRSDNFPWQQLLTLKDAQGTALVAARVREFAHRNVPYYPRGSLVGGIFTCDDPVNCTDRTPWLPLIAEPEVVAMQFRQHLHIVRYVPLMHTADTADLRYFDACATNEEELHRWRQRVDPNEQYSYSSVDKAMPWYIANQGLNKLAAALKYADDYFPWEKEAKVIDNEPPRVRNKMADAVDSFLGS